MIELRKNQREAIDSVYDGWAKGLEGNFLICAPTGSGKSVIIAFLIKELFENWGARILVLTHTKEIITQNVQKILTIWPMAPVGIYSAGIGRKELHEQIVFAGIQSIASKISTTRPFDICIVDECHLIDTNENTRYKKTLDLLSVMNPNMRVIGLTASPFRLGSGWIHKGENRIFHHMVYDIKIQELIDQGFLSNIIPQGGSVKVNTDGVSLRGKEFVPGELEAAAMKGETTADAIKDIVERGKDRKCWLIFSCGTKHSEQILECLRSHDISAEMISADTPKALRDRYINEHKSGQIKCLVNCSVLTVGYDNPRVDLLALIRPTKSESLYLQLVGRGMRIFPGKENCLFLDYTHTSTDLGPIDALDPDNKQKGQGVPPAKECPSCQAIIAAGFRICPVCGHEFPAPVPKIAPRPVAAPVLKSQILPQEYEVTGCRYCRHVKQGKKDSIRVEYTCGFLTFKEWVFPDAGTTQLAFYYGKFMSAAGVEYTRWPRTVEAFLAAPPRSPSRIWVTQEGKFDRVTRKEYGAGAPEVEVDRPSMREQKERYDMEKEAKEPIYLDDVPF